MLYSFEEILNTINKYIEGLKFDYKPQSLFDPVTYILEIGGKRVRPALALMANNLYSEEVNAALPVAAGIEIFHNFTLLHDDLMDKAEMRRGKPTVHIKWNDNTAILSGDAMLIEAYKEVAKVPAEKLPAVLDLFSKTAMEICCGQQMDMEFETRLNVEIPEYLEMIKLKTAVLLGCALKEGAMLGGASVTDADALYDFGINIGLAFQLKDDLLDVYGDKAEFGKRIGGDILCNKKTFLLINALQNEGTRQKLMPWIENKEYNEEEKIAAVTSIYNELDLKTKSEQLIQEYYKKAIAFLDEVSVPVERKKELYALAENLMFRKS